MSVIEEALKAIAEHGPSAEVHKRKYTSAKKMTPARSTVTRLKAVDVLIEHLAFLQAQNTLYRDRFHKLYLMCNSNAPASDVQKRFLDDESEM